ncbi:MAG: cation diffusion facilitator family transporter [Xanthobacteraceae bacterium]|uniref:cation diffusion facilitator family transporter n=1 Tax=Pseudolabrys sp. TaxID=1960880 RepID=UPI003D152D4F
MSARNQSKGVVYAALLGNLLVALTKLGAALWTGSSAMLSETVHSFVDTGNQGVLLYGIHRAALPPDERHPLGYGRELYFWSFTVALLMFTVGAGATFYEGVQHIISPHPVENALVNYAVLGASAVFEGSTWIYAWREFRKSAGGEGLLAAARRSKDPPGFIVLFEDSAAMLGLLIAAVGLAAAQAFDMPMLDGVASIGISLLLGTVAILLAYESKELLIGEPAERGIRQSIMEIVGGNGAIERSRLLFTVHLAPHQIIVALSLEFRDSLDATAIEQAVRDVETAIKQRHPEVLAIFVKPQAIGSASTADLLRLGQSRPAG